MFKFYKKYQNYILLITSFQLLIIFLSLFLISIGSNNSTEAINIVYGSYYTNSLADIFRMSIITPIYEEVIYRLIIYGVLSKILSKRKAVIISALLFALAHNNARIIQAFFAGVIFCEFFISTKKIIYPILLHSFANIIGILSNYGNLYVFPMIISSEIVVTILFIGISIIFYKSLKKYIYKRRILEETSSLVQ